MIQGKEVSGSKSKEVAHGHKPAAKTAGGMPDASSSSGCSTPAAVPPTPSSPQTETAQVKFIANVYESRCFNGPRLARWPLSDQSLDSACNSVRCVAERLIEVLPDAQGYDYFTVVIEFVLEYAADGSPQRTCSLAQMLRTPRGIWKEYKGL